MAPVLRPNLLSVMAQATSPSPRLWPPETCNEHTALTIGTSGGVGGSGSSADEAASFSSSSDKERAPWPVTLGTLLALQLGWGLWLMPAVYAR
jgi:vesicular inhibitory amino acid transporter